MKWHDAMVVRIYITEHTNVLKPIVEYLKQQAHIRGVTVFRAISGFGDSSKMHTSSLVDLSLDLPLVIEFFDAPEKITSTLEHLETWVKPEHIICWQAQVNEKD